METPAQFKVCSGCGLSIPATVENFHRQSAGKYGFTSKCKKCKSAQVAAWELKNKDRRRNQQNRWKWNNYEKYLQIKRDYQHRRRAESIGKVTVEEWSEILAIYDGKCARCGSTHDITQDHIIPLSTGGKNIASNIQPLCRKCNSTKGTKTIDYRKGS